MAEPAPERTPPDDDTAREKLTHDDDGALTDLAMEASDAIRHFPFDDYGVTVGDPNDEDAEWVFELAVAATEAVLRGRGLSLKQAAATLLADKAKPPDDTTEGGEEFAAYADEAREWANATLPTALEGWPDDTTAPDSPRHTPIVPNPCGATRDALFVGDGVHVCNHIPEHGHAADDPEHICCCGSVWTWHR